MDTLRILISALTVLAACGLFAAAGRVLASWAFGRGFDLPLPFRAGFYFFVGRAVFLDVWRSLATLTGSAALPLYLTLAGLAALVAWRTTRGEIRGMLSGISAGARSHAPWVAALSLVLTLALPVYWSDPMDYGIHSMVGSAHATKYAAVAHFVFQQDRIPIVGQNYGQSLLAAVPLFFGSDRSYLALSLWLSLSSVALTLMVLGLIAGFTGRRWGIVLGSLTVLLGNTALSLVRVVSVDNGYPPLLSGYSDSVSGYASALAFLAILGMWLAGRTASLIGTVAVLAVLAFSWNLSSPQDVITFVPLLAAALFLHLRGRPGGVKQAAAVLAVVVVAVAAGALQGGILAPWDMQEKLPFISTSLGDAPMVASPYTVLPHAFSLASMTRSIWAGQLMYLPESLGDLRLTNATISGPEYARRRVSLWAELRKGTPETIIPLVVAVELHLWEALRTIFFPLLGIVLLGWVSLGAPAEDPKPVIPARLLFAVAAACLAMGFLIAFPISLAGRKWELSRMMMSGYLLGMLSLWIAALRLRERLGPRAGKLLVGLLVFAACAGPLVDTAIIMARHLPDAGAAIARLAAAPNLDWGGLRH